MIGPGPSSIERAGTLKAPACPSLESNLRRVYGETEIRPLRHEVRVGGWPISYEAAGEGEPIVLVHGLSGSTRWWSRNVPAIAERYRVYLVDLPGFGTLRSLRRRFVLAETATWLSEWMEAAGLERVHLVGHSMGATYPSGSPPADRSWCTVWCSSHLPGCHRSAPCSDTSSPSCLRPAMRRRPSCRCSFGTH